MRFTVMLIGIFLSVIALSNVGYADSFTLAEAAALPDGTQVTIDQAVVINSIRMTQAGTDLIQVRDDTRAISIFVGSGVLSFDDFLTDIQVGDVISFTATTNNFSGLFELIEPTEPASIVISPTIDTSLLPVPVSTIDFADFSPTAEGLESRYVVLEDIELLFPFGGTPGVGDPFSGSTHYIARDGNGNLSDIWVRSQESADTLNAHFGTIPSGFIDLPGIFLHSFGGSEVENGIAGVNYLLMPVFIPEPATLSLLALGGIMLIRRRRCVV